jgi:hypothetical protein
MLRAIVFLALSVVAGCVTSSPTLNRVLPADPYPGNGGKFLGTPAHAPRLALDEFSTFQIGTTTKAQVVAALGKPEGWTSLPDGTSVLGYAYSGEPVRILNQSATPIVYASFSFDANRILSHMSLPRDPNGG